MNIKALRFFAAKGMVGRVMCIYTCWKKLIDTNCIMRFESISHENLIIVHIANYKSTSM